MEPVYPYTRLAVFSGENLYNRRAMIVRYTVPYSMLAEFTV